MKKVGILTLGCRVNQYESQAIAEQLEELGYSIVPFSDNCDVYIINTCTVTAESDRKSKQMIGRALARKNENSDVIVCAIGCFTQNRKQILKPGEIFKLDGVDIIGGNSDKSRIAEIIHSYILSRSREPLDILRNMENIRDFENISLKKSNNVRAYLKVQDGCNNFCTYCIVPIVRGRVRSKPIEKIKNDLLLLRQSGYNEVVFCGIEISAYGEDKGNGLISLASAAQEAGFKRVRFGSLNPVLFERDFVQRLSEISVVMPHFHLSVQSASGNVLNAMGRKYDPLQLYRGIENIYKYFNDVTLSCDLICGFPGESDDDFQQTIEFVHNNRFIHAHIFPYSRRKGTPAADFNGQLSSKLKKARCAQLLSVAHEKRKQIFDQHLGTSASVLIENKKNGFWFGHTENFMPVALKTDSTPGSFVKVRLSDKFEYVSDELSFVID